MRSLVLLAIIFVACTDTSAPPSHAAAQLVLAGPADTIYGQSFAVQYEYRDAGGQPTRECGANPDALTWLVTNVRGDTVTPDTITTVSLTARRQYFHVAGADSSHFAVTANAPCTLAKTPLAAAVLYNPPALGADPTAIVRNGSSDPVLWWWFDGQATSGMDTIPPNTVRCERFLAQPDSARFDLADSVRIKANGQGWYTYSSNWFDPASRPFWTVNITGYSALVADTLDLPC